MVYIWYIYGIYVVYIWYICGIYMVYIWYIYIWYIYIPAAYVYRLALLGDDVRLVQHNNYYACLAGMACS
jgi:hypothetical protein